jgi:hypothetical protein
MGRLKYRFNLNWLFQYPWGKTGCRGKFTLIYWQSLITPQSVGISVGVSSPARLLIHSVRDAELPVVCRRVVVCVAGGRRGRFGATPDRPTAGATDPPVETRFPCDLTGSHAVEETTSLIAQLPATTSATRSTTRRMWLSTTTP